KTFSENRLYFFTKLACE
ncbi:Lipid-A-disaccharide synthase, partial [Haemophilus influenzae]